MKILETFWNKKSYRSDESKTSGLKNVFIISSVSTILSIAMLLGWFFSSIDFQNPKAAFDNFTGELLTYYPDQLVLTVKDGLVSKNMQGSINLGEGKDYGNGIERFVQIDDTKTISLSALEDSKAGVFIGKDGVIAYKSNNRQVQAFPSKDIDNFTLEKSLMVSMRDKVEGGVNLALIVLVIASIVLGSLFAFVGNLLWNLFLAYLIKLTNLIKKDISFADAFKFTNYASVPAILITTFVHFPFLYTAIVLIGLWFCFKHKA